MKTYWNGEECEAARVRVIVGPPLKPTWWCADLEGKEYPAIRITCKGEEPFYISDDEQGWAKITKGRGMFQYSHKSVPVEREIAAIDREKPQITEEQVMCSGCWDVADKKVTGWVYTRFKHLDTVTLCPKCQYAYGDDFEKMMKAGL